MSTTTISAPVPFDAGKANSEAHSATVQKMNREKGVMQLLRAERVEKAAPDTMAGTTADRSTAVDNDPVSALLQSGDVIEPPFDMLTLAMLEEQNSELRQCFDALEINIEGFGHRFVPRLRLDDNGKPDKKNLPEALGKEVEEERVGLENFFAYGARDESFTAFRRKLRKDRESTGNSYFEVIRDGLGNIQAFQHVPSYQVLLSRIEDVPEKVDMPILQLQADGSVKVVKISRWKAFRRYVQRRTVHNRTLAAIGGYKTVWFKEWGDPRTYDNRTGKLVTDAAELARLPEWARANELVHMKLYAPRSPYGLPRFIGNLLSIFGDRAAEEINYVTFKNNNIPSMVVLVAGGELTQGSVDRLSAFAETQIQGSANYSKFLVIEAEGTEETDAGGQPKLDIKPLVKEQHKDALFQNYSANNQDKIRRVFRLPPIFVGRSDDYTRATAEASRKLADEQIFAPERGEFDDWVNRILFPAMSVRYHKYRSNSPNTTDNAELVAILSNAEKTGGMTPRIARAVLQEIFGRELPDFPDDFDADTPFSLTMAEAVKNQADPTEPGQQVTALKILQDLTGALAVTATNEPSVEEHVQKLVKIQKALETQLLAARELHDEAESRAQADHQVDQG